MLARLAINDYDGMIDDYTQVIKLKPNDANAYEKRGLAKQKLGDYDGAIKVL